MADLFVIHRTSGRRAADTYSSAPEISIALRIVLVVLAVFGALWLVYALGTLILLLIFSVLFAYLVDPLVAFVQQRFVLGRRRRELPRGPAIGIAYLVIFGAVALVMAWVARLGADAPMLA